jgi:hypothetical protein
LHAKHQEDTEMTTTSYHSSSPVTSTIVSVAVITAALVLPVILALLSAAVVAIASTEVAINPDLVSLIELSVLQTPLNLMFTTQLARQHHVLDEGHLTLWTGKVNLHTSWLFDTLTLVIICRETLN